MFYLVSFFISVGNEEHSVTRLPEGSILRARLLTVATSSRESEKLEDSGAVQLVNSLQRVIIAFPSLSVVCVLGGS